MGRISAQKKTPLYQAVNPKSKIQNPKFVSPPSKKARSKKFYKDFLKKKNKLVPGATVKYRDVKKVGQRVLVECRYVWRWQVK
jgi:sporulation protein YlmC with PRC-barrel domain